MKPTEFCSLEPSTPKHETMRTKHLNSHIKTDQPSYTQQHLFLDPLHASQLRSTIPKTTKTKASPAALFLSHSIPNQVSPDPIGAACSDQYVFQDIIGYGSSCIVRRALNKTTQESVAIKIVLASLQDTFKRELEIWKSVYHPFVLSLRHSWTENTTWYLVSDYCANGNLLNYLNRHKQLEEPEAQRLFRQLCQGIQYLHQQCNICHKDLKLENILLDHALNIKIGDFGMAVWFDQSQEQMAGGSLAYVAPEQLMSQKVLADPATDVWSLGVILYGLVVGTLPFMEGYELRLQQAILKGEFDLPLYLSEELQHLILGCLAYDPKQRWTIRDILNSSWLLS